MSCIACTVLASRQPDPKYWASVLSLVSFTVNLWVRELLLKEHELPLSSEKESQNVSTGKVLGNPFLEDTCRVRCGETENTESKHSSFVYSLLATTPDYVIRLKSWRQVPVSPARFHCLVEELWIYEQLQCTITIQYRHMCMCEYTSAFTHTYTLTHSPTHPSTHPLLLTPNPDCQSTDCQSRQFFWEIRLEM